MTRRNVSDKKKKEHTLKGTFDNFMGINRNSDNTKSDTLKPKTEITKKEPEKKIESWWDTKWLYIIAIIVVIIIIVAFIVWFVFSDSGTPVGAASKSLDASCSSYEDSYGGANSCEDSYDDNNQLDRLRNPKYEIPSVST